MSKNFTMTGRQKLSGQYLVQGNKNAALPLLSAALLSKSVVRFQNVPQIADVASLLQLMEALSVTVSWENGTLSVDSREFRGGELPFDLVEKLRGSILLLGALAPHMDSISCPLPGGCPIGSPTTKPAARR